MNKTIATILAASSVSIAACTRTPSSEPEPEPAPERTQLALQYVPGDELGERRIAAAQGAVRASPTADGYLALATAFMRRRRETWTPIYMTYARDALEAALALASDDPQALLLLGMADHHAHRFEQAAASAREVIAFDPDRPDAYLLLGDASLELGRYSEAVEAYQAAMDRRPDLRAYNRAAYVTWLHGDVEPALQLLDVALDAGSRRDPEPSAWCYVDLGEIHRHRGDTRRTVAAAEQALARVPDYLPALTLRARAKAAAGAVDAALADYREVVARAPTVDTLVELAALHEARDEPKEAARRRAQARVLAASDPRPFAHDLARRNVETKEALRLAKAALTERETIFTWDTYGLALVRAGRLDEAETAFDRAQALESPIAEFELHRALHAVASGDRALASDRLKRARRINPRVAPRLAAEVQAALRGPSADDEGD